jgi:membrane protein YqaA with SNARE-associated domain
MNEQLKKIIKKFKLYTDRWWYGPAMAFLALLDNIVFIIPCDGIILASTLMQPKRWPLFAAFVAVGSTLGAIILCLVVQEQGLPWVVSTFDGIEKTFAWIWTEKFFNHYGLIILFLICASPIMQQPVIILATLAQTPLQTLILIIFAGKIIKYIILCSIAAHSPNYLNKLWGVQDEMEDVGLK